MKILINHVRLLVLHLVQLKLLSQVSKAPFCTLEQIILFCSIDCQFNFRCHLKWQVLSHFRFSSYIFPDRLHEELNRQLSFHITLEKCIHLHTLKLSFRVLYILINRFLLKFSSDLSFETHLIHNSG